MAESTSLDATLKLLQSLSGKGNTVTTKGGTTTQQTMLSQDTINATLKSALEENQGLASLAAGQSNTGMYNSTVNQQMTNDLLARLTTNAAVAGAPKVTTNPTTKQTTSDGGGGMNSLLMAAGLGYSKKGIDKLLAGDFWNSGADTAVSSGANTAIDFVDTNTLAGVEAASGGGSSLIDSISSMFGGTAIDTAVGSGFDSALWGMGSDVASSVVEESAVDAGTSLLGEGTVICTESARQGLLDVSKYKAEISKLLVTPLNPYIASGYHFLAAPVVARMVKNKRVAKFFAKWAEAYIDGDLFNKRRAKYYFIRGVLFPVCYVIGRIRGKETTGIPC